MIDPAVLRGRDVLALDDLSPAEVAYVLKRAAIGKAEWTAGQRYTPLAGCAVAVILQKPSMRTRISFELACTRLGAHPVILSGTDSALSRGESVYDTAKVMERYVDAIVVRTYAQSLLDELADAASVPVINALTDEHHPCQGLADLLTIQEHLGRLAGVRMTYVGDGSNNMAHTYLLGGALTGMHVTIGTPEQYQPDADVLRRAEAIAAETGGSVAVVSDASRAVADAEVVATDTWASMGQEDEHAERVDVFVPFRVDEALMRLAAPEALFVHCLPAHRGEEVTDAVIDGPRSVVFDEAENRLHAQKALLELVVGGREL